MSKLLTYKGFYGSTEYSHEDGVFCGEIEFISDLVTFEADTEDQLEKEFRDAVDHYLSTCQKLGRKPETPFPGKVIVELPPDLHIAIAKNACQEHKSIDSWIADACRKMISDQVHSEPARKAA